MEKAPFELYSKDDAENCLRQASEILKRLREEIEH